MPPEVTTLVGIDGSDTRFGTPIDDLLLGLDGRDRLLGAAGNDTLIGGAGDDRLSGDAGDDVLFGGAGRNTLFGGTGADRFVLETVEPQLVSDFETAAGDRIVIAIPELLDDEGQPETSLLRLRDIGSDVVLEGAIGGAFVALANLRGGAGLALNEVVLEPGADVPAAFDLAAIDGDNGFVINGAAAGDRSGSSVSAAGDINGDGIDDIIIGAPYADPNGDRSGQSYVVFGREGGFPVDLDLTDLDGDNGFALNGVDVFDSSGEAVSAAGDVNGDGIDDLIVGADNADFGGQSYVVFGRESRFPDTVELSELDGSDGFTLRGQAVNDFYGSGFGSSFDSAGDINGDGQDDLIFGAPFAFGDLFYSGRAYIVFDEREIVEGKIEIDQLDGRNGFVFNGNFYDENAGVSVSSAGDINGDGFDDVIIGASTPFRTDFYGNVLGGEGRSFVVFGHDGEFPAELGPDDLDGRNGFVITGVVEGDRSGRSVSAAGDVNGDGIDDIVVGAPGAYDKGQVHIVFGNKDGFSATFDLAQLNGANGFTLDGVSVDDGLGVSVSGAGDLNGDGIADLIIGTPYADPNGDRSGQSYIVFGRAAGFDASIDLGELDGRNGFAINGEAVGDRSGFAVSAAGDLNNDGVDDVIIGARDADPNGDASGRTYVVFGGPDIAARIDGATRAPEGAFAVGDVSRPHPSASGIVTTFELTTHVGTAANDVLSGTTIADTLLGFDGRDRLLGAAGADTLLGGASDDRLSGGPGDDVLLGGEGHNTLFGGTGADRFVLETTELQLVGDFDATERDRIVIALPELLDAEGVPETSLLRLREAGPDLLLEGAIDGAFVTLASLDGAAGLALDQVVLRPEADIRGDPATTATLTSGDEVRSSIEFSDDEDWYQVELEAGFDYVFSLEGDSLSDVPLFDTLFRLYDDQGVLIAEDDDGGARQSSRLVFRAAEDQKLFAAAAGFTDAIRDYQLTLVSFTDDIPGAVTTEEVLLVQGNVGSTIDAPFDEDWFRVEVEAGTTYLFELEGTGELVGALADPLVRLYDNDGVLIASSNDGGSASDTRLFLEAQRDETIFVSAGGVEDSVGDYRLSAEFVAQPTAIDLANLNGTNGFALNGVAPGDLSGFSVSGAGDFNGDGFGDVIVGALNAEPNDPFSGQSYVVFGSGNTFPPELELAALDGADGFALNGINRFDNSGASVTGAGDVNGDGLDDVIVGAVGADPNGSSSGRSYVFFGRSEGLPAAFDLDQLDGSNGFALNGRNAYDFLGEDVGAAGDVNGDGFDDLIVIAAYGGTREYNTEAYVVFGRREGFSAELEVSDIDGNTGFTVTGVSRYFNNYFSVSGAGDVNGDGFDDVVIGSSGAQPNGYGSGQSYVVFGSAERASASIDTGELDGRNGFILNGVEAEARSGISVSGAGDVNGDGFDDIIIGAPGDPYAGDLGQSYVVFGAADGFEAELDLDALDGSNGFALNGVIAGEQAGVGVSGAGDVNGDGLDDLIVGAPNAANVTNPPEPPAGRAFLVFGQSEGFSAELNLGELDGSNGLAIEGIDARSDNEGFVSGAGDVNDDGFDDLIIGASIAGVERNSAGESYVVFGGPDLPASFNADDTARGTSLAEPDLFVA